MINATLATVSEKVTYLLRKLKLSKSISLHQTLNYTHSIEKTEFESIITNTLNIPKIDYTVKKIWNDFNDLLLQSFLLSGGSIELRFNLKNDNKNRNTI